MSSLDTHSQCKELFRNMSVLISHSEFHSADVIQWTYQKQPERGMGAWLTNLNGNHASQFYY